MRFLRNTGYICICLCVYIWQRIISGLGKRGGHTGLCISSWQCSSLFMAGFGFCLLEKSQRLENAETESLQVSFLLAFVSAVCFWAFIPFEKGRILWKNQNCFYS